MIDTLSTIIGSLLVSLTLIANMVTNALFGVPIGKLIPLEYATTTAYRTETASSSSVKKIEGRGATTTGAIPPTKNVVASSSKPTQTKPNVITDALDKTITASLPVAPTLTPPPVTPSFSGINTSVRSALVNILCITQNGGPLEPISGSGVIIDASGVILTNAHIAEYLLLQNFLTPGYIECTARTGSPARNTYTIELIYISPEWITENAHTIVETSPTGTGEHDFALLRITGRTDPSEPLVLPVPSLRPEIREPNEGEGVLIGAYPAGFLGGIAIQKDLYSASAISTVKEIFTFDLANETADLMSVGGTVVAQKGSSGGAVVNGKGNVIGLIVTATEATNTSDRDLRAITLGHVNRDLLEYAGISLENLLKSNLAAYARTFNMTVAPGLTAKLEAAVKSQQ